MAAELQIYVICARHLPSDWGEEADPYAVVTYHGHKQKTKADRDAGRNPNWNKRFSFPLGHPPGNLQIRIYDADMGFDDFKGQCEIDIGERVMNCGNRVRDWFPLRGKHGEGRYGEIELELVVEYSAQYTPENAAKLASLEKAEDRSEMSQMLAGAAALAAAGVAAYAGSQAATGHGNKTTNSVIAGVAGAAAVAAGGYAVHEHLKENKIEKQQEQLGGAKHGWFD